MTDYFSFYGLPVSFHPDQGLVKQQFYAFSKKYHPDFYINESEGKQAEVLEMSTVNNKAYQVLSDPQKLLHYVLESRGVLKEGENYILPQSFLMDMMEVNEALMDLQFDPDPGKLIALKEQISNIEKEISDEIAVLTAGFEVKAETEQNHVLAKVKDLYYRNKYLIRIGERIKSSASR